MDSRLATRVAVSLVSVGMVAAALTMPTIASAAPAQPASDGPTAAEPVSPAMLAALQRDLNLTPDQARTRVAQEDRAARIEAGLRKGLGANFGGAWYSAAAGTLVVGVTNSAFANRVRLAGAQSKVVSRTEGQLNAVKSKLDQAAGRAGSAVAGWYVDVQTNKVVVVARSGAAAKTFIAASGADATAVSVVESTESPTTLYDVIGGDPYYMGGRCSIGFSVNGGFVTAGHCGRVGTATQGYNQVAQGTFAGSSFPGNDYAWVRVNSNWVPRGLVDNYSGGTVTVSGSQESAVGASICRSGSTTGWHCGTVQAKNSTVNYPQGTVTGLTRTNVCAEPGDSGGSWLSGSQAQGVTSGGSGNCSSGGTTYFQPVNEILGAYGLTLVTGDGGNPPPPPPPGGCQDYEITQTGTLSGTNAVQYHPNGSYYYSSISGTHRGCLDGPTGVDFDLYLQKYSGGRWVDVAGGTSSGPDETLTYSGTAGYYRFQVHSYRGSGSYTVGITNP
jgi:streptogrisin C